MCFVIVQGYNVKTENIVAKQGTSVRLICDTDIQDPNVYWYKHHDYDSKTLIANWFKGDPYVIPRFSNAAEITPNFTLIFYDIPKEAAGLYQCKVAPQAGNGTTVRSYTTLTILGWYLHFMSINSLFHVSSFGDDMHSPWTWLLSKILGINLKPHK